jgi:hypothetical protein
MTAGLCSPSLCAETGINVRPFKRILAQQGNCQISIFVYLIIGFNDGITSDSTESTPYKQNFRQIYAKHLVRPFVAFDKLGIQSLSILSGLLT